MMLRSMSCCGVREVSGLSGHKSAPEAMRSLCGYVLKPDGGYPTSDGSPVKPGDTTFRAGFNPRFRYVFFTQAQPSKMEGAGYGFSFAAFIRKHKLGEVVIASEGDHVNPNSGNQLKMWTWTVDHEALAKWFKNDSTAVGRVKAAVKKAVSK